MIKNTHETALDTIDKAILRALQADARVSNLELARQVHLSPPATLTRRKRLEEAGYVDRYVAIVNREKAGYDLLCFIHISLQVHQLAQVEKFRAAVRKMPEVLECHHITGEYDYLLKVAVRDRKDLERFVVGHLTPLPGVARIHTSLVFTEVKATTALSLE
jgi:DNA-binding Lrp family transcriptional regulator